MKQRSLKDVASMHIGSIFVSVQVLFVEGSLILVSE